MDSKAKAENTIGLAETVNANGSSVPTQNGTPTERGNTSTTANPIKTTNEPVVVVGGDQNIDYNIIQVEDKNEVTSIWTGRFLSYIRASYGGPALLAYVLDNTGQSDSQGKVYGVYLAKRGGKPASSIAGFPTMLTLWTEHDKEINDGSNKDVAWRMKESLSNTFIMDDCFVVPDLAAAEKLGKTPRMVVINDFNTSLRAAFSGEFTKEAAHAKPPPLDLSAIDPEEHAEAKEKHAKAEQMYADYVKRKENNEKAQKLVEWIVAEENTLRFVIVKIKDRDITHNISSNPSSTHHYRPLGSNASGQNVMIPALLQRTNEAASDKARALAAERLIVVTSVDDLRGWGAVISRELSWERTVQDIVKYASANIDNVSDALFGCRHIVVSLGTAGAVYVVRKSANDIEATLFFTRDVIENSFQQSFPGGMRGYDTCLVCSIAHHLMMLCIDRKEKGHIEKYGSVETDDAVEADLGKGIANGILAARLFHRCGLVESDPKVTTDEEHSFLQTQYVGHEQLDPPHPLFLPTQYVKKVIVRTDYTDKAPSTINELVDKETDKRDGYVCAAKVHETAMQKIVSPPDAGDGKSYFDRSWWSFFDQEVIRQTPAASGEFANPREATALRIAENVLRNGLRALTFGGDECQEALPFACTKDKLFKVPIATFGEMQTVDRHEIESFRNLRAVIQEYKDSDRDKPLNIAVFGPPGSGKSFAVKQIAKSLGFPLKDRTFNLSQFEEAELLFEALHEVRDINLEGKMPLVFWDEFDTSFQGADFGWLHYFLAPMQDGRFQMAQVSHPIGKAIFVFAGSIFHRFADLPLTELPRPVSDSPKSESQKKPSKKATSVEADKRGKSEEQEDTNNKAASWVAAKGVDFVSRLEGSIDIEGPNKPFSKEDAPDHFNYLIRRALLVRGILERSYPAMFSRDNILRIDQDVVDAFLKTSEFYHGARSIEKIILMSSLHGASSFKVSYLPADFQMGLHVNALDFERHYRMKK